jgi:hypothetical protein
MAFRPNGAINFTTAWKTIAALSRSRLEPFHAKLTV